MNQAGSIRSGYASALREYIAKAEEAALERAYELGRQAIAAGLGVLEMTELHHEALMQALAAGGDFDDAARIVKSAEHFFEESLTPFEMAHRGFREAYAALRASEERYRDLFENANDVIFTIDLAGNFTSINRAGEHITGYLRHETSNMNVVQVVAPEYLGVVRQILGRQIVGEGPTTYELEIVAKDGHRVPLEVSTRLIYEDGRLVGVQGIARDIKERQQVDEALRQVTATLEAEARRVTRAFQEEARQILTSADTELEQLARSLPLPERRRARTIRELLRRIEEQLRRLSPETRPPLLGVPEALSAGPPMAAGDTLAGERPAQVEATHRRRDSEAGESRVEDAEPGLPATGGSKLGTQHRNEHLRLLVHSGKMRAIADVIEQVADTNATVLIRGETGVGKDIVARAIHDVSPRHDHPFIRVNCASFPTELLESELFGHEKGAFTGAYRRNVGKFEAADRGTFFLDEIGELPLPLQAKFLHVLQDQEFSRVGGAAMIKVDVRVIASTNRDLEAAIAGGRFREDLYYRLNVIEIQVPPLRERKEEIPILTAFFLDKFNSEYTRQVEFPPEMIGLFTAYPWPGNVRELENMVRRLVVLGNTQQIQDELRGRLAAAPMKPPESVPGGETPEHLADPDFSQGLREVARQAALDAERKALREVLENVRWNRAQAARILKVSYKTLRNKIEECGLG
jgi:PAS domain S-box-containing protein